MKSFFNARVVLEAANGDSLRDDSLTKSTVGTDANQIVPMDTDPAGTALMVHSIKNHIASITICWGRGVRLALRLSLHCGSVRWVLKGKLLLCSGFVTVVVQKLVVSFPMFTDWRVGCK